MTKDQLALWARNPVTAEVVRLLRERYPCNYRLADSWDKKLVFDGRNDVLAKLEDISWLMEQLNGSE